MTRKSTIPVPIYYNGWVVQPHPPRDIFFVYERLDTANPANIHFGKFEDALDYIDNEIAKGGTGNVV